VPEFIRVDERIRVGLDRITPVQVGDRLFVFSMSLLTGEDRGVAMSGEQYGQLLRDVVKCSEWNVSYQIVDMPAGLGSELLSLVSVFGNELLGSVIVTQPAHVLDARRLIELHVNNDIPVIGLIENMSGFECEHGEIYPIFGESVVDKLADEYGVRAFGSIPLSMEIRDAVAAGKPLLKRKLGKPIRECVNEILKLKPRRPGFLERVSEKVRGVVERAVVEMVVAVNQFIPIKTIMAEERLPGGSIVRLNLMDTDMTC